MDERGVVSRHQQMDKHNTEMPSYFLADIPDSAILTPALVREACIAIKSNRRRVFANRTTKQIIRTISVLAEEWCDPESPFRRQVRAASPQQTGFPPEVVDAGLQAFFESVDEQALLGLIEQDLGHPDRLDQLVATPIERASRRQAIATGPELIVHITGGLLPNPAIVSLILGLLLRAAQFMKCATGTAFIPRLFAHSLRQIDSALASTIEIAEWPGGTEPLEEALFAQADVVCATGNDDTLRAIRARLPAHVRWVGYGHRLSIGYVAKESMRRQQLVQLAERIAEDVAAWNQLGCLSPHVIYVEKGGQVEPKELAAAIAQALDQMERVRPRGPIPIEVASTIRQMRDFYQIRAAALPSTRVWMSHNSTAWTVIYDEEPNFQPSCLYRTLFVKAVCSLEEALEGANRLRGKISTVGLAAPPSRAEQIVQALSSWQVCRICPFGHMQRPPLTWRHDGRPSLGEFVFWTDWEMPWT